MKIIILTPNACWNICNFDLGIHMVIGLGFFGVLNAHFLTFCLGWGLATNLYPLTEDKSKTQQITD